MNHSEPLFSAHGTWRVRFGGEKGPGLVGILPFVSYNHMLLFFFELVLFL